MALITRDEAVPVLKKKKPRRGSIQKVYNQITDLDEFQLINDENEKKTIKD